MEQLKGTLFLQNGCATHFVAGEYTTCVAAKTKAKQVSLKTGPVRVHIWKKVLHAGTISAQNLYQVVCPIVQERATDVAILAGWQTIGYAQMGEYTEK